MILISFFEFLGTIAFAISGALVGIEKKLDIFGVTFLGIITAVGGGIFRDIIIGKVPPDAFQKPIYCLIGLVASIITFIFYNKITKLKNVILISDAIGLGVFTAIGSNAAFTYNMDKIFIVMTMGLFTGIGGGILRDVSVQHIPLVFRKEIYAIASILGSLTFYICYDYLPKIACLYICCFVTFSVRMISIKYKLNLPVNKTEKPRN